MNAMEMEMMRRVPGRVRCSLMCVCMNVYLRRRELTTHLVQAGRYVRLVRLGYASIALLFMAVLMLSEIRREEENTGYRSASQQSTVVLSDDVGWGSAAMAWLDGSKVLAVHGDSRPRHAADLPGSSLRAISLPAAVHRGAHPVLLPAQSQLADAKIPCQADCGEEGATAGVGNTLRYGHVNRKGQQQLAWWSKVVPPASTFENE